MTATTTVPVHRVKDTYFQKDHVRGLWTIVGFLLGILAAVAFIACMFLVEINERVVESTNEAGQTVQRTVVDTAWGTDGMVGFVFPIALFVIVWLLFASARLLTHDWQKVGAILVSIVIGIALGAWVTDLIGEDLDSALVALGFAASMAMIVGAMLSHVYYVRRQRAHTTEMLVCKDWITRCEHALEDAGVDMSSI